MPEDQQLLPDTPVRCPSCEISRLWMYFDAPPENVDALATCPDCGIHILGFDSITENDREECAEFLRTVNWDKYR